MASSYAIPVSPNYHYHHQHSHSYTPSYSSIQLSPKRERTNSLNNGNRSNGYGNYVKKTSSNGSLYTHAEVSPERSSLPQALPNLSQDPSHNSPYNVSTFQANGHVIETQNTHTHQHTTSFSSMKSRPRGESDLGRPKSAHHHAQSTASIPSSSAPLLSIPEALTSLLVPLPFLLASAAFPATVSVQDAATSQSAFTKLQHSVLEEDGIATHPRIRVGSAWIDTCIITSGSLILVGCLAKVRASTRSVNQIKEKVEQMSSLSTLLNPSTLQYTVTRTLSVGLPFYASSLIGGSKTGMILLVSYAASQAGPGRFLDATSQDWKHLVKSRSLTLAVIFVSLVLDVLGVTSTASLSNTFAGYLALACSMLALDSPLPKGTVTNNATPSQAPSSTMQTSRNSFLSASPLMRTLHDTHITLLAGVVTSVFTVVASMIFSETWNMTTTSLALDLLAIALFTTAVFLSRPASLHSRRKAGLALGCFSASIWSILTPYNRTGMVGDSILAILFYFSVYIDTIPSLTHKPHDHHDHDIAHNTHDHKHIHSSTSGKHHSAFTQMILDSCEPGSLVYDIVSEKDSRRIAYFTLLNFGFMLVQGGYGYLSGSLGLLSDTVHMFFDCLGLVVGLGAAVAAKWPTSPEKPYGWGKLNTLAGFGNGIFLMLVSVEFVWEAIEGILEHRELRHVQELLVVSTLGFLVNMVGLFAFGHAHAGHDHGGGHSHGHSHSHDHSHSHSHDHSTAHNHAHSHSHSHAHSHAHEDEHNHSHGHAHGDHCNHKHEPKAHSHSHDHDNENMHGIFLHVAADAGGSLAVILSTALTLWKPWYLWDPLATIIIAVLIFAAAVPLVTSSGRKLLLIVPNQLEYSIKNTLQELSEFRGVIGYTVPRFWIDDKDAAGDSHGHHHHGHDHSSGAGREKVMGVIHIIVAASASLEEVKHRVEDFVRERDMDLVIHVEREGEGHEMCWCGGGQRVV